MTEAAIATETARQRMQRAEAARSATQAAKARQNARKRFAAADDRKAAE